jgi:hypothetical protein
MSNSESKKKENGVVTFPARVCSGKRKNGPDAVSHNA